MKILVWGGKLKARLLLNLLSQPKSLNIKKKISFSGLFDPKLKKPIFKTKLRFYYKKQDLKKLINQSKYFICCVGSNKSRYYISEKLTQYKLKPLDIKSNFTTIDKTVKLGKGIQIMPNVVINSFCEVGDYCILNTSATLDHDCIIKNGVHIMGGASIAGGVQIDNFAIVGTNATIFPNIKIGENSIVGAGAVVNKNVPRNTVVVGNPAKVLKKNYVRQNLDIFKNL